MDTIQELMQRPYTLIHKPSSLELVELGIKVKIENKLDEAFSKLNSEKEEYFQNMLAHNAQHLIPQPLVWRKNLPLHQSLNIKHWIIKCGIASACFIASALIVISFARKSLNRSIEKLDEVLNPTIQDEQKKIEILKNNLDKYRPYIKEIVKTVEEEKRNISKK